MASFALQRVFFSLPVFRPFALSSAAWRIPSLPSLWEQLLPAILRAVPKKKVSHSRKSMRSANKGLKDKQNIVNCSACGTAKLAHNICPNCYSSLRRMWKKLAPNSEI